MSTATSTEEWFVRLDRGGEPKYDKFVLVTIEEKDDGVWDDLRGVILWDSDAEEWYIQWFPGWVPYPNEHLLRSLADVLGVFNGYGDDKDSLKALFKKDKKV